MFVMFLFVGGVWLMFCIVVFGWLFVLFMCCFGSCYYDLWIKILVVLYYDLLVY